MHATKHILHGFYAMRMISEKHHRLSPTERAILDFTADERQLLCRRICHVFQVLASCIMLEYSLTDAIPTVDSTKDRLLNKIYEFRRDHMSNREDGADGKVAQVGEGERDYALLYAYILVAAQVAEELRKVREEIEGLFGVLEDQALLLE